jgi:predicted restriction endonuclease
MEGMCKCGRPTNKYRTYCNECYQFFSIEEQTYGQLKARTKYQKNSRIRMHARKKYMNSGFPKCCIACGYSKHIDICHVKDISSFPDETLIKEINDLSNLVALCKNHHWEFDNKFMSYNENLKVETYLSGILPAGVAPAYVNLEG